MMNENTRNFIDKHQDDDVYALSLLSSKYPDVDMQLAVRQITGKQKIKYKVPIFFECDKLLYPARLSLEQSSSEKTGQHKAGLCKGNTLIDLTGGFGVDSFFFSFRFEKVIYVERQAELCKLAEHNFKALKRENILIVNDTAENFLEKTDHADWIFLDPARRTESGKKAVLLSDCEPNATEMIDKLLAKSDNVMIKLSPMVDVASLIKELPDIAEIHIVSVDNECKEVVVVLKKNSTEKISIKTTNYPNNKPVESFDYFLDEEPKAQASYADQLHTYLYEPNSSIMKSGAFRLTSARFNIDKLHINSHLYTSKTFIHDFPGRTFKVIKIYDFSKNSLKDFHSSINKANLAIRNFPMSVNELRKKLKLAEGGDTYVFAATIKDGKKVLISCRKVG